MSKIDYAEIVRRHRAMVLEKYRTQPLDKAKYLSETKHGDKLPTVYGWAVVGQYVFKGHFTRHREVYQQPFASFAKAKAEGWFLTKRDALCYLRDKLAAIYADRLDALDQKIAGASALELDHHLHQTETPDASTETALPIEPTEVAGSAGEGGAEQGGQVAAGETGDWFDKSQQPFSNGKSY